MNLLALCGSLRKDSTNAAVLRAIQKLLPSQAVWKTFEIGQLPFFDPALQFDSGVPRPVQELRALAQKCDSIVISTPEYAHGIPGVLKNALEWMICEETMKKKVAVIIASPSGGNYVREYLNETLQTMDLVTDQNLTLIVTSARKHITLDGQVLEPALREQFGAFVNNLMATAP